jgi:hypothetical protein
VVMQVWDLKISRYLLPAITGSNFLQGFDFK